MTCLRILGVKAVQDYLLREVLSVYRQQGVNISDKHIEIIVRQMLRKVRVEDCGDTSLLPGALVDIFRFEEANREPIESGGRPAIAKRILLGITKASLATESFLSAASFQETTRVLTDAAIKGKVDPLLGVEGERDHRQANPRGHRHARGIRISSSSKTSKQINAADRITICRFS